MHLLSIWATTVLRQSQWPRGLRRRSAASRLLRLWVRIPPGTWMFVCCECYVLSGRGLCDELITRPEESYRLWCVVVCDLETSRMRRPWPTGGCRAKTNKQTNKRGLFSLCLLSGAVHVVQSPAGTRSVSVSKMIANGLSKRNSRTLMTVISICTDLCFKCKWMF